MFGPSGPRKCCCCCIYCGGIGHCLHRTCSTRDILLYLLANTPLLWRWEVSWHFYPATDRNVMPWLLVYPPNIKTLMGNKKTHQIWIVVGSNRLASSIHLRLGLVGAAADLFEEQLQLWLDLTNLLWIACILLIVFCVCNITSLKIKNYQLQHSEGSRQEIKN